VSVNVSAPRGAAPGQVKLRWDGRLLAVLTLRDGRAIVRVPSTWVTHGRHRLQVRYAGSGDLAPCQAVARPRVR
jgi:hypothetical protein